MNSIPEFHEWILYSENSPVMPFDDFLTKYKPHSRHAGARWIAVSTPSTNHVTFIDEEGLHQTGLGIGAKGIEVNLTAKVQAIEYDKAIPQYPTNGHYNTKKHYREQEFSRAADALKKLATNDRHVSGKWLFYPAPEEINEMWEKIARAIIEPDGALRGKVFTAKVSPFPPDENGRHRLYVYVENSWDRTSVGDVYKALVTDLRLQPACYKADVYNLAGIGFDHSSKIKHFLYGKTEFMTKEAIAAALAPVHSKGTRTAASTNIGTALEGFSSKQDVKGAVQREMGAGTKRPNYEAEHSDSEDYWSDDEERKSKHHLKKAKK